MSSGKDHGTTVMLRLPLAGRCHVPDKSCARNRKTSRVLILEEDPLI